MGGASVTDSVSATAATAAGIAKSVLLCVVGINVLTALREAAQVCVVAAVVAAATAVIAGVAIIAGIERVRKVEAVHETSCIRTAAGVTATAAPPIAAPSVAIAVATAGEEILERAKKRTAARIAISLIAITLIAHILLPL